MGDLAYSHGFYGTEWKGPGRFGEAGEALIVTGALIDLIDHTSLNWPTLIADPNEAWVFHILPDGTDLSAVWAAQRSA